jgi:hypothetical protein
MMTIIQIDLFLQKMEAGKNREVSKQKREKERQGETD